MKTKIDYSVELDRIVSKEMRDELQEALLPAYIRLRELGYIKENSEGCVTARKMFYHIFKAFSTRDYDQETKLADWVFAETHINEEKLDSYGM